MEESLRSLLVCERSSLFRLESEWRHVEGQIRRLLSRCLGEPIGAFGDWESQQTRLRAAVNKRLEERQSHLRLLQLGEHRGRLVRDELREKLSEALAQDQSEFAKLLATAKTRRHEFVRRNAVDRIVRKSALIESRPRSCPYEGDRRRQATKSPRNSESAERSNTEYSSPRLSFKGQKERGFDIVFSESSDFLLSSESLVEKRSVGVGPEDFFSVAEDDLKVEDSASSLETVRDDTSCPRPQPQTPLKETETPLVQRETPVRQTETLLKQRETPLRQTGSQPQLLIQTDKESHQLSAANPSSAKRELQHPSLKARESSPLKESHKDLQQSSSTQETLPSLIDKEPLPSLTDREPLPSSTNEDIQQFLDCQHVTESATDQSGSGVSGSGDNSRAAKEIDQLLDETLESETGLQLLDEKKRAEAEKELKESTIDRVGPEGGRGENERVETAAGENERMETGSALCGVSKSVPSRLAGFPSTLFTDLNRGARQVQDLLSGHIKTLLSPGSRSRSAPPQKVAARQSAVMSLLSPSIPPARRQIHWKPTPFVHSNKLNVKKMIGLTKQLLKDDSRDNTSTTS